MIDRFSQLKTSYSAARVMSFAMMGAVFCYWVVARLLVLSAPSHSQDNTGMMRIIFYFLSASCIPSILVLKKMFLRKKPQDNLAILLGQLTLSNLITMALCETPVLYGLILYFIVGVSTDFYVLMAFSLTLLILFFPRFTQWEEYTAGVNS